MVDEFTRARGRRVQRVVARFSAGERQTAGQRHLDDGRAFRQSPFGDDGIAERAGDGGGAVGAAEHLEQSVAAVGHRDLDALDAEFPARMADRRGHLAGGQRPLELVAGR